MNPLIHIKNQYERTLARFQLVEEFVAVGADKIPPDNAYFGLTLKEVKDETDAIRNYIDNLFVLGLVASFESYAKNRYLETIIDRLNIEEELNPFKKGVYQRLKEFGEKRIRIEEMLKDYSPLVDETLIGSIREIIDHRHQVAHGATPFIDENNEPTLVFEKLTAFLEHSGLLDSEV